MPILRDADPTAPRGVTLTDGGIAVVPVLGPLVARSDWLSALFGAIGYGDVGAAVAAAFADPSARAVLLEIDSPGGEVGGLFDLVETIRGLRAQTGKPLWAVASESALSAAYAIASATDRLYVTRTGEVGSIGVVAAHRDASGADAMAGLKWTLIHAGAKKVDGNPHEPLSPRADLQADVDALQDKLVALIARNRGLAPEAVRATEAAIYRGQRGIDAGLADRIGTRDQALADLAAALNAVRATAPGARHRSAASPRPTGSTSMPTLDLTGPTDAAEAPAPETAAPPPDPVALISDPAPAIAAEQASAAAADRLRAEYAEIAAVAAQAARLGIAIDAAEAMRQGTKPDALRRSVLDALAARSEATAVVTAAPAPAAPGDSPIVRRARERASALGSGPASRP